MFLTARVLLVAVALQSFVAQAEAPDDSSVRRPLRAPGMEEPAQAALNEPAPPSEAVPATAATPLSTEPEAPTTGLRIARESAMGLAGGFAGMFLGGAVGLVGGFVLDPLGDGAGLGLWVGVPVGVMMVTAVGVESGGRGAGGLGLSSATALGALVGFIPAAIFFFPAASKHFGDLAFWAPAILTAPCSLLGAVVGYELSHAARARRREAGSAVKLSFAPLPGGAGVSVAGGF